jgi:hypothetical protein
MSTQMSQPTPLQNLQGLLGNAMPRQQPPTSVPQQQNNGGGQAAQLSQLLTMLQQVSFCSLI